MSKSPITCHVLDASLGKPAAGITVKLVQLNVTDADAVEGITNADGRCLDLLPPGTTLAPGGAYKLQFLTSQYFSSTNRKTFYPYVEITFVVENPAEHFHVPLLISPYSYTTYRGS